MSAQVPRAVAERTFDAELVSLDDLEAELVEVARRAARVERACCMAEIAAEAKRMKRAGLHAEARALEVVWERLQNGGA